MEMLIKTMSRVKLRKEEISIDVEIAVGGACGGIEKIQEYDGYLTLVNNNMRRAV